jgi:hypothetical protein
VKRFLLGVLTGSLIFGSLAHAEEIQTICQSVTVKVKPCKNPLEMYFEQGRVPYRCRTT